MQIKFAWNRHSFRQYIWSESLSFRLGIAVVAIVVAIPIQVQAKNIDLSSNSNTTNITTLRNSRQLAQADGVPLNITGVKLNPRGSGIEVFLETAGSIASPSPKIIGNLLYFDIPNATIAQPFQAANPAPGVGSVSVTQIDSGNVRVAIIGSSGTPQATVIAGVAGTNPEPVAQTGEPELEINVTGLRNQRGYKILNAASATGTNTPIIETPFAVQVIPKELIRDRQSRDVRDAITNVSGVAYGGDRQNRGGNSFSIRGFADATILNDGFLQLGSAGEAGTRPTTEIANVEKIEVLKGPASILYGAILF